MQDVIGENSIPSSVPITVYIHAYVCTWCLKIDATHKYDNDLLLRQVQCWSLGTYPVKNASFEQETSNQFFF